MLCAPLFTEAEGVWGIRAVRDSGRQDDWRGHRSRWDMGCRRRAAPSRDVHRCVCGFPSRVFCLCYISLLPTAHKTPFFSLLLAYAVWRGPSGRWGCKSSKRVRMEAYPMRSGTRNKLKLTRSEQSVRILRDLESKELRVGIPDVHSCIALVNISVFVCAVFFMLNFLLKSMTATSYM